MISAYSKSDDGTITLTVNVPWAKIKETRETVIDKAVKEVEIKGFRKGKAPRETAKKQLDQNKIYEEAIKQIVPEAYLEALKEHKVNPIVQPEIKLTQAKEDNDWQFTAKTCEKPKVDLGNYQEEIKKARGEMKKDEIWVPGKEQKEKPQDAQKKREKQLNTILETLLRKAKVNIPSVILTAEMAKKMTRLVDELEKLGLTVDKYLETKGKTPQQYQEGIKEEITKTYKLEFILEEIAESEKVTVSDEEIQKVLSSVQSQSEKKALEGQKYYLASLLRRQKTLDKLLGL